MPISKKEEEGDEDVVEKKMELEKSLVTNKKVDEVFPYWNRDPFVLYLNIPREYKTSPSPSPTARSPSPTTSPGKKDKR